MTHNRQDQKKCALIGYGYWGKIVEKYLRTSEYFELVEIYDPNNFVVSLDLIMDDKDIECVFICSPVDTHFELVAQSLEAGKHVFCEKPLCKTSVEAKRLQKLAIEKNLCLYTDLIYTVSQSINKLKELLEVIGNVKYVKGTITQFGNFYMNDSVYEIIGIHMLSAILHIFETKIDTFKFRRIKNYYSSDSGNVLYGIIDCTLDGFDVYIENSLISCEKRREVEIIGDRGMLKFDMMSNPTVKLINYENIKYKVDQTEEDYEFDEKNNINLVLKDFYKKMKSNDHKNLSLSVKLVDLLTKVGSV